MALNNQQLLKQAQVSEDRETIAKGMVELAVRAEESPFLQEMLRKVKLRPPFDIFEYVKPYNRKGYWRRIRANREHPSIAEAKFRLAASIINTDLYGTKGVVERTDGTRIPLKDYLAGEMLRGRKFTSEEEKAEREKQDVIERIARRV